jgi:hypothetical protein
MSPRERGERQKVVDNEVARTLGIRPGGGSTVAQAAAAVIEEEDGREKDRSTARTPHEVNRSDRRFTFSLPTPEWKKAVQEEADRWDVRPSDFLTFCVAFTMRAIDNGELRVPHKKGPVRYHHRAGEVLTLPWSPGSWMD